MSKPEDVYFTRKMVRKIRGKKEPIVIEVPDKYTPAQKKGMRGIKKIEERDPLSLNYLKKKSSSGETRQKLKEANLMLQKRGKDISDILVKKRKQAEERKAKEVVFPPEFIKLIESLKPGAKKKLTPQELQKQEQERRDGFDYFNKVFDRIANEKLPKRIVPSFRMQFINLPSNKEKIDFLKDLLKSKDLKKLYLTDEELAELKRDKENAERREKGLPPLEDLEDIPPLAPITETEESEPERPRRRRRARTGTSTTATETEESDAELSRRPIRFARPSFRGRYPSPTESDRERLGLDVGRTRRNYLREDLATQAERTGLPLEPESEDFFSQPEEGELAIPNLEDIDLPVGTMVGEGLMLKRGRGRPRKHPIKGAGFFDKVGDLVKQGISAGIDYVKKDPIGTAKKAYEYGKKGFELYKSRKAKKTEEKGGALLAKPTRGHSTYQSYF